MSTEDFIAKINSIPSIPPSLKEWIELRAHHFDEKHQKKLLTILKLYHAHDEQILTHGLQTLYADGREMKKRIRTRREEFDQGESFDPFAA